METDCIHNPGLVCEVRTRVCEHCGFSPKEDARRRGLIARGGIKKSKGGYKSLKLGKRRKRIAD